MVIFFQVKYNTHATMTNLCVFSVRAKIPVANITHCNSFYIKSTGLQSMFLERGLSQKNCGEEWPNADENFLFGVYGYLNYHYLIALSSQPVP
jgi:hypothetical protein